MLRRKMLERWEAYPFAQEVADRVKNAELNEKWCKICKPVPKTQWEILVFSFEAMAENKSRKRSVILAKRWGGYNAKTIKKPCRN